jgi:hypothetical protein
MTRRRRALAATIVIASAMATAPAYSEHAEAAEYAASAESDVEVLATAHASLVANPPPSRVPGPSPPARPPAADKLTVLVRGGIGS